MSLETEQFIRNKVIPWFKKSLPELEGLVAEIDRRSELNKAVMEISRKLLGEKIIELSMAIAKITGAGQDEPQTDKKKSGDAIPAAPKPKRSDKKKSGK